MKHLDVQSDNMFSHHRMDNEHEDPIEIIHHLVNQSVSITPTPPKIAENQTTTQSVPSLESTTKQVHPRKLTAFQREPWFNATKHEMSQTQINRCSSDLLTLLRVLTSESLRNASKVIMCTFERANLSLIKPHGSPKELWHVWE